MNQSSAHVSQSHGVSPLCVGLGILCGVAIASVLITKQFKLHTCCTDTKEDLEWYKRGGVFECPEDLVEVMHHPPGPVFPLWDIYPLISTFNRR